MQWIGRTALATALVAGCGQASSPPAPEAKACGRLVAFYRSIDAAVEMAKGCPVVTLGGGSVEVAETFEIDMG